MKTLLIGNDNFITDSLVKRLNIEGEQIHIVCDSYNVVEKKKDYIYTYEHNLLGDELEDIFKVQRPDVVIFYNNMQKDLYDDMLIHDVVEHIAGLMRIFNLSDTYDVDKFIYISTVDLYKEELPHVQENSKLNVADFWRHAHYMCEQHIEKTRHIVHPKSIILRTSLVYGNGQSKRYNPILTYIHKIKTDYSDKQYIAKRFVDFINVEDFALAVYTATQSEYVGILNIASGKYMFDEDVADLVSCISKGEEFSFQDKTFNVIDISTAARMLDFTPNIELEQGISDFVKYEFEHYKADEKQKKNIFRNAFNFIREKLRNRSAVTNFFIALFENLLGFALIVYLVSVRDITMFFGYIDIRIIYIFIAGSVFGLRQSGLSVLLCMGFMIWDQFSFGYDLLAIMFEPKTMAALFIFLLAGIAVGYTTDINKNKIKDITLREASANEQLKHMKSVYMDSLKVKNHLQEQIYSTKNSTGKLFDALSKLNSLDINELRREVIYVAEQVMDNKSIALYMFGSNTNFLRLVAKSRNAGKIKKTIVAQDNEIIARVLETKQTSIIDNNLNILMAAPILNEHEVIAVLTMHNAPVDKLTLSYQNLFTITTKLIRQAIVRAYQYQQSQESEWYFEDTRIMKPEYFNINLERAKGYSLNNIGEYVLLTIPKKPDKDVAKIAIGYVREFDYVGITEDQIVSVLLNDTNINEAEIVVKRLQELGGLENITYEKV